MELEAFAQSLPFMAKGLAGIFCVTGLIILAMMLLKRIRAK